MREREEESDREERDHNPTYFIFVCRNSNFFFTSVNIVSERMKDQVLDEGAGPQNPWERKTSLGQSSMFLKLPFSAVFA